MSLETLAFKFFCWKGDRKRDKNLVPPENVEAAINIPYFGSDKYHLTDIYYPAGTDKKLPTIISVHGGGYVYGTKEVYWPYCMYLASLGFTVVNFNYPLAPKHKFPQQLNDVNRLMWMVNDNADHYFIDKENIFIVGDSAGAQLASQYITAYTNPEYAKTCNLITPSELKIRACALNCGLYTMDFGDKSKTAIDISALKEAYLGKKISPQVEKQLDVVTNITKDFPPSFIMTSEYDFLQGHAKPMYEFLTSLGIPCRFKKYGSPEQKYMGHVFHLNMNLEEAKICNNEEIEFFKEYIS